jgi:hypothetical protein
VSVSSGAQRLGSVDHVLWHPTSWYAKAAGQSYYYEITVETTGVLRHVNLGLPQGAMVSGTLNHSSNIGGAATLISHGNYIEYRLASPYSVGGGWKLRITITGLTNPPTSKNLTFQCTAWSTGNTVLANGTSYPVSFAQPPAFPDTGTYPVPDEACSPASYTIAGENQRPGSSSLATKPVTSPAQIEGFADRVSAGCGQTVTLRVRVNDGSATYRAEVFRMGYYAGVGSRLVYGLGTFTATAQPAPYTVPQISLGDGTVRESVVTNWRPSVQFKVQSDWTPGTYQIRLTSAVGYQALIPFVVRHDASTSEYLVVIGHNTYQAYNTWGGTSLYKNVLPPTVSASAARPAVVASFDRPYEDGIDSPFAVSEYGFVRWAEGNGLDVTYTTDNDLNRLPETLGRHRTLVVLSHAEYWTDQARAAVAAAVESGMNLINLGANQFYWRIQQQTGLVSALPDRSVYTYRSGATGLFRDGGQPEQTLLGAQYMGGYGSAGDVIVSDNWLFTGTGLAPGARITNLSYNEVDVVAPGYPAPAGVTVLSHSPLRTYQNQPATGQFHDIVFHVKPSGARVFSAGTQGWCPGLLGRAGIPAPILRTMTQNVIDQIRNDQ